MEKFIYTFNQNNSEGNADMRELLGGKGANLAEMASLGIPVPAGFTITTAVCNHFYANNQSYPERFADELKLALNQTETIMQKIFGDPDNPLLLSVRSGARTSMPGMMETVLNIGLTSKTIDGLIKLTGDECFTLDCYRRLITMYSDVVMEKASAIEVDEEGGIRHKLEKILNTLKKEKGYHHDHQLTPDDFRWLCDQYLDTVTKTLGSDFPDDPHEQLRGAISAVFKSWNGKRAVAFRRIEGIPDEWGTAINVQSMVFGNLNQDSATGVAFTRNPATGENHFYGEWLPNAQGEDVVSGNRTPNPLNEESRNEGNELPSLEKVMPKIYQELAEYRLLLEKHFHDMQDLEFTIESGRLFMLQTRVGKRNGMAALKMAVEMQKEKLIETSEAILRLKPEQLDELLHPMVDPLAEKGARTLARGLPAGPGGACGKVVFSPEKAVEWSKRGEKVILVRMETSAEDVHGMHVADAILTARGGMTSHAALVARGWGKCCIVGCHDLDIETGETPRARIKEMTIQEGDTITLNGTRGFIYAGELPLIAVDPHKNPDLKIFLSWCDEARRLGVRANADQPDDAILARQLGAEGIGLCRTEHMFFEPERIKFVQLMILADSPSERREAIMKLLPFQKEDFRGLLRAMNGNPVTIRLLDPPLHEFMPHDKSQQELLARELGCTLEHIHLQIENIAESNPMLGHRGCRLGISYPEITEMQSRAILEAAAELRKEGVDAHPEIMVPLVGNVKELGNQRAIIKRVYDEIQASNDAVPPLIIGTMIEVPRGAITADEIATEAEFFSFGTNDLTQMGGGFSRDDSSSFIPHYVELGIYKKDPFESIDQEGIGQLIKIAIEKGKSTRPRIMLGICGEHGGDPDSIDFFHRAGLHYVSCSPFRIPIARLAAAQASIIHGSS